jgi:hypothetical protein
VLRNASVTYGDPAFWDENDGPSSATGSAVSDIGSQSFQILGPPGVPEPAAWALMLVGFAGLGAALSFRAPCRVMT